MTRQENYSRNHLRSKKEIGDRNGQGTCYGILGAVYKSVEGYEMAIEHLQKSLAINKVIGDRNKEGDCYITLELCINQLVNMTRRGNYSRNHFKKEIGDRNG